MKKLGAETIIIIMLVPILMTLSGYVASKAIDNENDISSLKTADEYQIEMLREVRGDIKTLLKKVK